MYTSILMLALSSSFGHTGAELPSPRWLEDYTAASRQGAAEQKPLAVFVGSGEAGWERLSRDGKLGKEAKSLLSERYVCLYIDTGTLEGKKLARAFAISQGVGLVISDRTGETQAFHHEGDLKADDLDYYLKRYADPSFVVRTTETNPPERATVPAYRAPSFGTFQLGGGGGGC